MRFSNALMLMLLVIFGHGCATKNGKTIQSSDIESVGPGDSSGSGTAAISEGEEAIRSSSSARLGVVCTFNISFLGHWTEKKNEDIAKLLRKCDIVAIQELIATPVELHFTKPDGSQETLEKDDEAAAFFEAMKNEHFESAMAPEDTGRTDNHSNGTASEFPVVFYKATKIERGDQVKEGYWSAHEGEAPILVGNPVFDRVPYAFSFRWKLPTHASASLVDDGASTHHQSQQGARGNDFVVISVHLHAAQQGESHEDGTARRNSEISTILKWCERMQASTGEKDYLFMGDMNVESSEDVEEILSANPRWNTLNRAAAQTNLTSANRARPYDQVFFSKARASQIPQKLHIVDIMKPFPAGNMSSSIYLKFYSDHQLLYFNYKIQTDDD